MALSDDPSNTVNDYTGFAEQPQATPQKTPSSFNLFAHNATGANELFLNLGYGANDVSLEYIIKEINGILKNTPEDPNTKIQLLKISKDGQTGIYTSCSFLIVSLEINAPKYKDQMGIFIYVLESSIPDVPARNVNLPNTGMSVLVKIPPAVYVNGTMVRDERESIVGVAHQIMSNKYKNKNIIMSGLNVIPAHTQVLENPNLAYQLLWNALTCCYRKIELKVGGEMNLQTELGFLNNNSDTNNQNRRSVYAGISFEPNRQVLDIYGNPIRSDIAITLTSQIGERQFNEADEFTNPSKMQKDISTVSGWIDLAYLDNVQQFGYQQQINQNTYMPRFIITDVKTESTVPNTPGQIFLALATTTLLNQQNTWFKYFVPKPVPKHTFNPTDIGVLTRETFGFGNVDMREANSEFGKRVVWDEVPDVNAALCHLLQSLVVPRFTTSDNRSMPVGIGLAMDIDCDSANSPAFRDFYKAAIPSEKQLENNRNLFNYLSDFTSGEITKLWSADRLMFLTCEPILIGHFIGPNGTIIDLSNVGGYIEFANHADNNNSFGQLRAYSETFAPGLAQTGMQKHVILSKRASLLQQMVNHSITIRTWGIRATFNPEFIAALVTTLSGLGLMPQYSDRVGYNPMTRPFNPGLANAGINAALPIAPAFFGMGYSGYRNQGPSTNFW